MAYLEITKGKTVVQSPLGVEPMSIGRKPGNSIVINDPDISRRHCVIERADGQYAIYDLNSRNGTAVNGHRVRRTELKAGDVITLGGAVARFLDAPMKSVGRRNARRNYLILAPALTVFLIASFIVAWSAGLLGDGFSQDELLKALGIEPPAQPIARARSDAAQRDDRSSAPAPRAPQEEPPAVVQRSEGEPRATDSSDSQIAIEPASDRLRYRWLSASQPLTEADLLLGRAVAARFVGQPVADDAGRLIWEFPPDGEIAAVFEPATAAAQAALDAIQAEPLLLDVELAGVLRRDRDGSRVVLRVGVINVEHAWGQPDEMLQPATRALLGKRVVINGQFTVAAIEPAES